MRKSTPIIICTSASLQKVTLQTTLVALHELVTDSLATALSHTSFDEKAFQLECREAYQIDKLLLAEKEPHYGWYRKFEKKKF